MHKELRYQNCDRVSERRTYTMSFRTIKHICIEQSISTIFEEAFFIRFECIIKYAYKIKKTTRTKTSEFAHLKFNANKQTSIYLFSNLTINYTFNYCFLLYILYFKINVVFC